MTRQDSVPNGPHVCISIKGGPIGQILKSRGLRRMSSPYDMEDTVAADGSASDTSQCTFQRALLEASLRRESQVQSSFRIHQPLSHLRGLLHIQILPDVYKTSAQIPHVVKLD